MLVKFVEAAVGSPLGVLLPHVVGYAVDPQVVGDLTLASVVVDDPPWADSDGHEDPTSVRIREQVDAPYQVDELQREERYRQLDHVVVVRMQRVLRVVRESDGTDEAGERINPQEPLGCGGLVQIASQVYFDRMGQKLDGRDGPHVRDQRKVVVGAVCIALLQDREHDSVQEQSDQRLLYRLVLLLLVVQKRVECRNVHQIDQLARLEHESFKYPWELYVAVNVLSDPHQQSNLGVLNHVQVVLGDGLIIVVQAQVLSEVKGVQDQEDVPGELGDHCH
ncbi:hypothetical protein OJ253_757 [Cryptosporidium canis]|uniref:Uncharacterized protein n=1 Tax=Cryptosporidium canis TaxID=195482 RepID=A0A9D5DIA9_9CRYT|nr:hypothetical protein OJ253_757 [Cryptosporidium canis]